MQELEAFLRPRVGELVSIFHPFYHSKSRCSIATQYAGGQIERELRIPTFSKFGAPSYLRDFLVTLFIAIRLRRTYDLYIGSNPLNALAGLVLQKVRLVRETVFYKIDYVPIRFDNRVLNAFYQRVDRMCIEKCGWTWSLAEAMIEEEKRRHVNVGKKLIVPIGSNFERIERLPLEKMNSHRLVYVGSLRDGQGIELIIDTMHRIRKSIPDVELVIIGTGPLEHGLRERVKTLGVEPYVTFMGYVPDHVQVEGIVTHCGIGLATYEPGSRNFTQFTEPGKVKLYLACGLPVVITRVPEIARAIDEMGAGVVIEFDSDDLLKAVTKLAFDKHFYASARSKAISFASKNSWTRIFESALHSMSQADGDLEQKVHSPC